MFSYIWFSSSLYYLILVPFSWLYELVSTVNRMSYQYGWRKIYRSSVPIVIIGNLTVGGNGKTPMVIWLVEKLKYRGWKVGVVSRGYKGRAKSYPIILNDISNNNSDECGDEPLLIRNRTGVLVSIAPKRADAVSALLRVQPLLDVIISDDGLQHYALYRDIEWIIVNGMFRFGNGYCLPAGPMRERINRLNRAHAIIVNRSFSQETIRSDEISMVLCPVVVVNILTKEHKPLNFLRSVVAIAGIGHPMQFFMTLHKIGIFPVKEIAFPDHQIYSEAMLVSIANEEEVLLMTEKDAIKCLNFAHKNWWYLFVDVRIKKSDEIILLNKIEEKIRYYKNNHY